MQINSDKIAPFFNASIKLAPALARTCGHRDLSDFNSSDIAAWRHEITELSGIKFASLLSK